MIFNTGFYWGIPARVLHWLAAAMILFLYFHGQFASEQAEHGGSTYQLFIHAAAGATLALVMIARSIWRAVNKVPMLPAASPEWEKKAAGLAHHGLYLVTFATILIGWLHAGARKPLVEVKAFGFIPVPRLPLGEGWGKLLGEAHELFANLLMVLIVAHVIAALWHHFVRKDSVLRRMLFRGKNRAR